MGSNVITDIRFQRILEAREIICSSIIFSIHDSATHEAKTFVLDYITNDFTN